MHCVHITSVKVQLENLVNFGKKKVRTLSASLQPEVEVHGYLCEHRDIFEHYPVDKLEGVTRIFIFGLNPLVNEQLVALLLVSYEVFTTDYSEILIVLTLLHGNHLVWLPCLSLEECDGNFIDILVVGTVVNHDSVNFRDQEELHTRKLKALAAF